jgi:hypothetical protein
LGGLIGGWHVLEEANKMLADMFGMDEEDLDELGYG